MSDEYLFLSFVIHNIDMAALLRIVRNNLQGGDAERPGRCVSTQSVGTR